MGIMHLKFSLTHPVVLPQAVFSVYCFERFFTLSLDASKTVTICPSVSLYQTANSQVLYKHTTSVTHFGVLDVFYIKIVMYFTLKL